MSTHMVPPIRGSTALSPPGGRAVRGVGDALRAAGVFLDTAFRVVVLGSDGTPRRSRPEPENPHRNVSLR